jgi:cation transport ATPase
MKEIFKKIFGLDNLGQKIGNLVDRFVQTKEEKAEFEKELTQIFIEAEKDMQQNVTERWKADMGSDSWLSKNVRPLVLLFLIVSTIVMIFIDAGAIKFNVQENWVDLLQIVLITVISAYFGGRSFEKIKNKK